MTERLVDPKVWKGSQSWNFESAWRIGPWVVRVQIIRDAYDAQSKLVVDILTKEGWKQLIWAMEGRS